MPKDTLDPKYLSDCHNAAVYVVGSGEGTNHYECIECKQACNFHPKDTLDNDMPNTQSTQMQNERGEWVPSIPLPFYGLRKQCSCGAKFWTEARYMEHYAYWHILFGKLPL